MERIIILIYVKFDFFVDLGNEGINYKLRIFSQLCNQYYGYVFFIVEVFCGDVE